MPGTVLVISGTVPELGMGLFLLTQSSPIQFIIIIVIVHFIQTKSSPQLWSGCTQLTSNPVRKYLAGY